MVKRALNFQDEGKEVIVTERERKDGKGPERKFIEWGNENEKCIELFTVLSSLSSCFLNGGCDSCYGQF